MRKFARDFLASRNYEVRHVKWRIFGPKNAAKMALLPTGPAAGPGRAGLFHDFSDIILATVARLFLEPRKFRLPEKPKFAIFGYVVYASLADFYPSLLNKRKSLQIRGLGNKAPVTGKMPPTVKNSPPASF